MKKLLPVFWILMIIVSGFVLNIIDGRRGFAVLDFGNKKFNLQLANTEQERQLGLGGQTSLPSNEGMVFVFDIPEAVCLWMQGMKFNIDIIWLDTNKRVIKIAKNISPNTYPQSFCPPSSAKYVVELNAGVAAQLGITPAQTLPLKL